MKINKRTFIYNLMCILAAVNALCGMHVVYVNMSYSYVGYLLALALDIITAGVMLGYIFIYKRRFSISKRKLFMLSIMLIFYTYTGLNYVSESGITLRTFLALLKIMSLFFLEEDETVNILNIFTKIFAAILLPCVIITILKNLGVQLPYSMIKPTGDGEIYHTYYNYFGCLILYEDSLYWRLCGIFNEPGVVGTISGLLLCKERFKLKGKWYNVVLALAGVFSFSTAFFILIIIYFVIEKMFMRLSIKKIVFSILTIVVVLLADQALCNISVEYKQFAHDKIVRFVTTGQSNRTRADFDLAYSELWESGDVFLGRGEGSRANYQVLSYKGVIYDYGIVGMFIFILMIIGIYRSVNWKNSYTRLYFLIYVISLY